MRDLAICFDLDGTVVDRQQAVNAGWRAAFRLLSQSTCLDSERKHRAAFDAAGATLKQRADRCGEPWWQIDEQLALAFGDIITPGTLANAAQTFRSEMNAHVTVFDDVEPVLRHFQASGVRLGILSNGERQHQRRKLESTGLLSKFDAVVTSEDVGAHKPAPEGFLAVCEELELPAHQVMHVGDDPLHDVRGALRAGLIAVWLGRDSADGRDCLGRTRTPAGIPIVATLWELLGLTNVN